MISDASLMREGTGVQSWLGLTLNFAARMDASSIGGSVPDLADLFEGL
jgi:hypothetical protein